MEPKFMPASLKKTLSGTSLAFIDPLDLDFELVQLYDWLCEYTTEPSRISDFEWDHTLPDFLNQFPATPFAFKGSFSDIALNYSLDFLARVRDTLLQIRQKVRVLMPTPALTSLPLEKHLNPRISYGGKRVLLPVSYRERLLLIMTSSQLPCVELFGVELEG